MTKLTGLDLLFLEVNSLHDSVEFYRELLGFELQTLTEETEPPMATLRAGRLRVMLAEQLLTMARRGRGVHLFFGVTDVDEYYEELQARGLVLAAPSDEGWGGRFVTLEDPDHYRLFFVTWEEELKD
ncbi:MAG TPA: VOC family protein [Pyrinomonadaceae bacterium]|jgi:catechol 2,3-dioxygenase-like lactoylglutathione lyase family enzyme|nr:VOC family protein [Pyrinomonadaceae bacterium]